MPSSKKIPRKEKKRRGRKAQSMPPTEPFRIVNHPAFGEIPLVTIDGITRCDPDFHPLLPAGAVRGNVHRQEFCSWCHFPKYFYLDEQRQCVDCRCPRRSEGRSSHD